MFDYFYGQSGEMFSYFRVPKILFRDIRFKDLSTDAKTLYEKHHSTVKDACELAEELGVENLVLYHTEDRNLARRKQLYREEGKAYFRGNLFVPDDLEILTL